MAREKFGKRILLCLKFIVQYIYCIIFRDLLRVLTMKRKSVVDQVVVITGGAMGIGKGLAQKFALEERAIVCILDINQDAGLQTVSEITEGGGRAYFFLCNVTKPDEIRFCAQQIFNSVNIGSIDILICNAAILRIGKLMDMTDNDYQNTVDVNILGYVYTVRAFLSKMIDRNCGQIVAIGSICSHFGDYLGTAYCTAKFAVRGFMETLQMELDEECKTGIVLTTIYPYFTETTLVSENMTEPFSTFFDVIPLNKCVEEIMDAVLKERMYYFIPQSLTFICIYAKCYATKYTLPYMRRFFNCRYKILKESNAKDVVVTIT